jgi:hypothetical protein
MMHQSHYHQLLSRGRKAGLTSRELNSALSIHPVGGDEQPGQADCNGYVSGIDTRGHRTYQPAAEPPKP